MRKHQFVKADCKCERRATYFTCKHCGAMEYCSLRELRRLDPVKALCTDAGAPEVPRAEAFKSRMGGTIDCLAPDYATWNEGKEPSDTSG